jgi:hypothetical protein
MPVAVTQRFLTSELSPSLAFLEKNLNILVPILVCLSTMKGNLDLVMLSPKRLRIFNKTNAQKHDSWQH